MVVKRKKILIYWKNKPHYSQNLLNLLKKDFDVFITGKIRGVYEKFKKNKYDIFIFTGWGKFIIFIILFLKFKSVKLVCMVDNTIKKNFKQFIGKLFFILFKKLVDFYFVPGKESEKLLRYFGINKKKICRGIYTANDKIFKKTIEINKRKNIFLFVGQIINRKNIFLLINSFKKINQIDPTWKLMLIGDNPNNINFSTFKKYNIFYKKRTSEKNLAWHYNNSQCLVLPSKIDHWGLVCLEAAKCGCPLIVSNKVGSKTELINGNGFIFNLDDRCDLFKKMKKFIFTNNKKVKEMSKKSIILSKKISQKKIFNLIKTL